VRLEPLFPGDQELERRIKSLIRWNALAMVVRAKSRRTQHWRTYFDLRIRGHAVEVGFNHFFRARTPEFEGDTIYFRDTRRRESMRARSWKEESALSNWRISVAS